MLEEQAEENAEIARLMEEDYDEERAKIAQVIKRYEIDEVALEEMKKAEDAVEKTYQDQIQEERNAGVKVIRDDLEYECEQESEALLTFFRWKQDK